MKKGRLTLTQKRGLTGYMFCIPWIVGFLLFFIFPVIQTAYYSFNIFDKVTLQPTFAGLKNYVYAFSGDAQFPQKLAIVKTIFFLTVILSSDLFLRMQDSVGAVNNAQMNAAMSESQELFTAMQAIDLSQYFTALGISPSIMNYINDAISNIFSIMIRSGVQIFIFLAALHSVPDSMYEAANMEGSTAWESFWTITFPMTGPTIMVNCIYTIVDSFGSYLNPVVTYINGISFTSFEFGYSSALSWVYFLCIAIIIAVIFLLFRKKLFYQN